MKKTIIVLFCLLISFANAQNLITQIAGDSTACGYGGDGGPALSAQLNQPMSTVFDATGNLYIADSFNNRVRKISPAGVISTVAGTGFNSYSGDGGPAVNAELNSPRGLAIDMQGNIFIADQMNNVIRKINTSGVISTFAGTGVNGYNGDGGQATLAQLQNPAGVGCDAAGNVYIADFNNGVVRKVSVSGIITTVAGGGFNFNDGIPATQAFIAKPVSVIVDAAGNLYIADVQYSKVSKVDVNGVFTTVTGNGTGGYTGDGGPANLAQVKSPEGLCLDALGNLYIGDKGNSVIRKINTSGIISTIAGNGNSCSGAPVNGIPATSTFLCSPRGPSFDSGGNLYFSEGCRIRKVGLAVGINSLEDAWIAEIYPNPAINAIEIKTKGIISDIKIRDLLGKEIENYRIKKSPDKTEIDMANLESGVYFITLTGNEGYITRKIIKQ